MLVYLLFYSMIIRKTFEIIQWFLTFSRKISRIMHFLFCFYEAMHMACINFFPYPKCCRISHHEPRRYHSSLYKKSYPLIYFVQKEGSKIKILLTWRFFFVFDQVIQKYISWAVGYKKDESYILEVHEQRVHVVLYPYHPSADHLVLLRIW